ncbi:hypothetical protein KY308_03855, partial [Candidatus Woesearchaeota archaeon]|nr:hypothetical protein [Candidatus Woesearchaeota archaeon]
YVYPAKDVKEENGISEGGLCFQHLRSQIAKEITFNARKAHLDEKYNIEKRKLIAQKNGERFVAPHSYELELKLAEFSFETGKDKLGYIMIQPCDPSELLTVKKTWDCVQERFPKIILSELVPPGRLSILTDVDDKLMSDDLDIIHHSIENSFRAPILCLARGTTLECHKKRRGDFGKFLEDAFNEYLIDYSRSTRQERANRFRRVA